MEENPYRGPESDTSGAPRRQSIFSLLNLLIAVGIVGLLIMLFLPAVRTAREPARRNACQNHLKQIAIALSIYEETYGAFPPAHTVDANGKPLHSWRTLILPFLEQRQLYESIDLTKPWDDPANDQARKTVVGEYCCPSATEWDNRTTYQAVVAPNSFFRPGEPRTISDVTDQTRETLMVIEVDAEHAVPWMAPVDTNEPVFLRIGPDSKLQHDGGLHVLCVDGSVRYLDAEAPRAQRRALVSIAGNDSAALDAPD
jgi:hypothetical protein